MKNFLKRGAVTLPLSVLAALLFTLWFRPGGSLAGLACVLIATGLCNVTLQLAVNRYDAQLRRRIAAQDSPTWEVHLNHVQVGSITDAEYAAIQRAAFRDGGNALAQLFNLGRMVLAMADKLLGVVPQVFFWSAAALVVFAPERLAEVIHAIQRADATQIANAVEVVTRVCGTIAVLAVGLMAALGHRFGFLNHYSECINRKLRQHCHTPAQGDVWLYRVAVGNVAPGLLTA